MAIEFTSRSTKEEDLEGKFALYRDILKVREYFLFDPQDEYLAPSLQGYRLADEEYVPIQLVEGWLPSEVLGLHLERDGWLLRLYDPQARKWLPTMWEEKQLREQAEAERAPKTENERLRRELEALRQKLGENP